MKRLRRLWDLRLRIFVSLEAAVKLDLEYL